MQSSMPKSLEALHPTKKTLKPAVEPGIDLFQVNKRWRVDPRSQLQVEYVMN